MTIKAASASAKQTNKTNKKETEGAKKEKEVLELVFPASRHLF